ncbi:MAG: (Fe-S)-binding protein [Proteobacteria bacterium]|nr:(Fe-S)-binding protein [Pseudomonadota bacterium]
MNLDRFKKEISYCTYCPKLCRFACPVAEAERKETSIPQVRQEILHLVRAGRLPLTPEIAETFHHCAFCLHCRTYCQHLIEVPAVMEEARGQAADYRGEKARNFLSRYNADGTPFGPRLNERINELIRAEKRVPEAQAVYLAGCTATKYRPGNITDTEKVFSRLGIDYVGFYAEEEFCCGMPLLNFGEYEAFKARAGKVAKKLSRYKLILSGCPACVYVLKVRYEQFGIRIPGKVQHITEFLDEKLGSWEARTPGGQKTSEFEAGSVPASPRPRLPAIFYHDPCYLGRYLGVFDPPRKILARVLGEPAGELFWSRQDSICCGGGGAVPLLFPETARKITARRLEEFGRKGGQLLVTSCPFCERNFQRQDPNIPVKDIVNIVLEKL